MDSKKGPNVLIRTFGWFKEEKHLRIAEVVSTLVVIAVVYLYLYGFRTGFNITRTNIIDATLDVVVLLVSAKMIIKTFARLAKYNVIASDEDIKEGTELHRQLIKKVDRKKLPKRLSEWNKLQIENKMENKRQSYIDKFEHKKERLINKPTRKDNKIEKLKSKKTKKQMFNKSTKFIEWRINRLSSKKTRRDSKLKKLNTLISLYKSSKMRVKVHHKWVKKSDILTTAHESSTSDEVTYDYDPVKDTQKNQLPSVFSSLVMIYLLRVAIDPKSADWDYLILFLSIAIPFLFVRSISAYLISTFKTQNLYIHAIQDKINIIEWCDVYENKREPN